jgi:hypothetical protein
MRTCRTCRERECRRLPDLDYIHLCIHLRNEIYAMLLLEHFQEKWNPVFRPKMRQRKMLERFLFPLKQKPL